MTSQPLSPARRTLGPLAAFLLLCGLLASMSPGTAQTYSILHRFGFNPSGTFPRAALSMDSSGRLLGAAEYGGPAGRGLLFTLQPDGSGFSILKSFNGPDGAWPGSGLCVTGATIYGSTVGGGPADQGTLFRLNTDGSGFTILHPFSDPADGAAPLGQLALAGPYLYGVTDQGGAGAGTVFRIGTNGTGFKVLHRFTGPDGLYPSGGLLVAGSALYGVTSSGGSTGDGVVYRLNTDGSGFAVLKELQDGIDGSLPSGGLLLHGGFLYGAAQWGGTFGSGTLFQLATNGSQFVVIKEFNGNDGNAPAGDLIASGSTLFGVTQWGGPAGNGVVFRIETDGRDFTPLHGFNLETEGASLVGGLLRSGSTLFGPATDGGPGAAGTIYRLDLDGSHLAVLHAFDPGDGINPNGAPVLSGPTLYGTTGGGGPGARGTIYSIGTNGAGYQLLHSFAGIYDANPVELTLSGSTLFGATSSGGRHNEGTIFRLETNGARFATLFEFDGTNGRAPLFRVAVAGPLIYGTAYGGAAGAESGTIFRLGTNGAGFQLLRRFAGPDGAYPSDVIVSGQSLYGTTYSGGAFGYGTLYRLNTDGSGFAVLRSFNWSDGANPHAGLVLDGDRLYGVTSSGGPLSEGVLFTLRTDGSDYTMLKTFAGAIGAYPDARLALAGSTLYGSTLWGGAIGFGTVFQIGTDGSGFKTLKHFTWDDGSETRAALTPAGTTLFGAAASGGSIEGGGVLFSLALTTDRPVIQLQPEPVSALVSTWATFRVLASGLPEVSYQWFHDGTNLLTAATNAVLQLPDVTSAQAGAYQVVIANASGSVTSNPARLSVLDPAVNGFSSPPPTSFGSEAEFSVDGWGTQPLSFQWWKDGVRLQDGSGITGSQSSTLRLTGVSGANTGRYSVVLTNVSGSVTSEPALFLVADPEITSPPGEVRANAGDPVDLTMEGAGSTPLHYQWYRNGSPLANGSRISGASSPNLHIDPVTTADAGAYSVSLANSFGQTVTAPVRLTVNAIVADDFATAVDEAVVALLPLPGATTSSDVLLGGGFSLVGGQSRSNLAWVRPEGGIDPGFNPGANDWVTCLAPRTSGGWLVAGWFTRCAGAPRDHLAAFDANGSLDASATPATDGRVTCLTVQPDGSVLVGGEFSLINGLPRRHLARLRPDLSLDTTFHPDPDAPVLCLAIQPDGRILVGGAFTTLGGQAHPRIGRLLADGTPDPSFTGGANDAVQAMVIRPDGRIVAGGVFTELGGLPSSRLGQLRPDGSLETSFGNGANDAVLALALQADGRLIVGGSFVSLRGEPRANLGRLLADGSIDPAFAPGADSAVSALTLLPDGSILAAGGFGTLADLPRLHLGRLSNSIVAVQQLAVAGSTVTWTRTGSAPEIGHAELEVSANGGSWSALGPGTRSASGWEWTGVTLPPRATLRARGTVAPGGGSPWITESASGPPALVTQPPDAQSPLGGSVSLRALAAGSPTLGFAWFKGATPLQDSPTIQGAKTPNLFLTSLAETDAGLYSLIVSNASGTVTSRLARLTVLNPFLVSGADSRTVDAGDRLVTTALAGGTTPLAYQWWKDGLPLTDTGSVSGSATPTLILDPVLGPDAGHYSATVQNSSGSVTGLIMILTVRDPVIRSSPAGQGLQLGQELRLSCAAYGSAPLTYRWQRADALIPGASTDSLVIPVTAGSDAGAYSVIVQNAFGSVTSAVALVSVNVAAADPLLAPSLGGTVNSLAFEDDGRMLVGGAFALSQGVVWRTHVARFLPNGSPDPSFNAEPSGPVGAILYQHDHRVVVGGEFTQIHGLPRPYLARLNSDGWPDNTAFPAPDGPVDALLLQPDGRLVVGGRFAHLGSSWHRGLARLNPDGSLDEGFQAEAGGDVRCLTAQPDGRLLIGGYFGVLGGIAVPYLGRLDPDGRIDSTFRPEPDGPVLAAALQADGAMIVGGDFATMSGTHRSRLARVRADGTLDLNWNPGANDTVRAVTVLSDGRVIVAGAFTQIAGQPRNRLARLLPDGSLDPTFNPDADGAVHALALSRSGQLAVGGNFTTIAGQPRLSLALLNVQDPPSVVEFLAHQTAEAGDTVQFRVRASGYPPLTYEFRQNGAPVLPPRTNTTLTLEGIQMAQAGAYTVTVSNRFGTVTSSTASLQVVPVVPRRAVPQLTFTGDPGSAWRLEAASGPEPTATWSTLATGLLEGPSSTHVDLSDPPAAQRFYRVAWASPPSFATSVSLHLVPALTVAGTPGTTWRIDAVPRFGPTNAWFTLGQITLTQPAEVVVDAAAAGLPPRIYRVVPLP